MEIFGFDDFSEGFNSERRDDIIRRFRERLYGGVGGDDVSLPNVEVLEELVEECLDEERFEIALQLCEHWISFAPYSHNAWLNKGIALTGLGKPEEALGCYDHADTLNPNDPDTLVNRGAAYDALGLDSKAMACYDQVLLRDPQNEEALFNKAIALERAEEYEPAARIFELLTRSQQFGRDSLYELRLLLRLSRAPW